MKYDFLIFENLYDVENHYKDLNVLAVLLRAAGYKVAILDAFKEAELCKVEGIAHLSVPLKYPKEFKTLHIYSKNKSRWKSLYYRVLKDIYLYRLIKKVNGMAPNIYLGSMTMATPAFFFRAFDKHTNYFMWALRSASCLFWKNKGVGLYHFVSMMLFKNIKRYPNLRLIVSNEIIMKEFEDIIGVQRDRLILRPERFVTKCVITRKKAKWEELKLLYIGTIRPSKNIEICLEAIKKANDVRIKYTIAGRARMDEKYGDKINNLAKELPNVNRIDRYIPDEEYEKLINECDFIVLCDKEEPSCASNGTMMEALLHGKPIIAPDINPFKFEVEKYGVGFLYHYENVDSLCNVLLKALDRGSDLFCANLESYQEKFLLQSIAKSLKKQIEYKNQ